MQSTFLDNFFSRYRCPLLNKNHKYIRCQTVVKSLRGSETNDGVDYSGSKDWGEGVDEGDDHSILLTVVTERRTYVP